MDISKSYPELLNAIREETAFLRWVEALVDSYSFHSLYGEWSPERRAEFEARVIARDRRSINGMLARSRNKAALMKEARHRGIRNWSRLTKKELEEILGRAPETT